MTHWVEMEAAADSHASIEGEKNVSDRNCFMNEKNKTKDDIGF